MLEPSSHDIDCFEGLIRDRAERSVQNLRKFGNVALTLVSSIEIGAENAFRSLSAFLTDAREVREKVYNHFPLPRIPQGACIGDLGLEPDDMVLTVSEPIAPISRVLQEDLGQ